MITDFAGPSIDQRDVDFVLDALKQENWYGNKKYEYVEKTEQFLAEYHGRKYCLLTPNCTSAIYLILSAYDVCAMDEVILPDFTWCASSFPVSMRHATPIFCDVDPETWCIDPKRVKELINKKTKAIVGVNVYGNMCDWLELQQIAISNNLLLFEDFAESLGSTYMNKRSGGFGNASFCSYHRTKTAAVGEMGSLLLDDEEIYKKCVKLRDLGRGPDTKPYFNEIISLKFMPSNLQAALLYGQMQRIDELVEKKRHLLFKYKDLLGDLKDISLNDDLAFDPESRTVNGAWTTALLFGHSYNIDIDSFLKKLVKRGVPARRFFYPLSKLPAYKGVSAQYFEKTPVANDISNRGINLPCALNLTDKDLEYICRAIKEELS